jgi:hypothetical protein
MGSIGENLRLIPKMIQKSVTGPFLNHFRHIPKQLQELVYDLRESSRGLTIANGSILTIWTHLRSIKPRGFDAVKSQFLKLFGYSYLFFRVKGYLFREEIALRRRFYKVPVFHQVDRTLRAAYRFRNPYRISKRFLQARGFQEVDLYGETPLTTLDQIARECGITSEDHLFELGSGRGRGAFFLRYCFGCRITGVEWIPAFVSQAKAIAALDLEAKIHFVCADFLEVDLSQASAIYLYGTCLEDELILALIERFLQLPKEVKIITVSFPLSDYSPHFSTIKQFSVSFPWGEGEIYLNLQS